jgi:hypothetical protein
MTKLNDVVSVARDYARTLLRTRMINRVRKSILSVNKDIAALEDNILKYGKCLARAAFAKAQINPNDPDAEELTKSYDADAKFANDSTAECKKEIEVLNTLVADNNKAIAAIESGETKVSADDLQAVSNDLLEEISKAAVVAAATKLEDAA